MPNYVILMTDKNLSVLGDPITAWTNIDVTLKFNEPGSGLFTAPGYSWIREQLVPGCRAVVVRDGLVLISGPVEGWKWERSDDGDNAGAGQVTVNFSDYLSLIASRCAYPNPALAPSDQNTDQWTFTGNAEVALRTLVDQNAGQNALPARKVPKLVLGTLAGVGSTVSAVADRMEPLGDVLRRIAVSGGNLGFRAQQGNSQIEFQVYDPPDLSNQIVFGFGAGSLKYISYEVDAPTVNAVIVGGQGDGADRYLIEQGNAGSQDVWDRREKLVSRPGNDPLADLQAAGNEELSGGAETARIPTSTADTPFMRYGRDYDLGSIVSVETWPGTMISDVIVTVHVQAYPTAGEVVSSTVGSQAASSDPAWLRRLRAMDKRLSYLERNVLPSA